MRRGELRGLLWEDIDEKGNIIHVQNNFQDLEGNKKCKCDSTRYVILPSIVIPLLEQLKSISNYTSNTDFVFFSLSKPKKEPISAEVIKIGFKRVLSEAGISKEQQKQRNITLHGVRHTFITLARSAGLPDTEEMALAGHRSPEMMQHYTHTEQIIDFNEARKKLEQVEGLGVSMGM